MWPTRFSFEIKVYIKIFSLKWHTNNNFNEIFYSNNLHEITDSRGNPCEKESDHIDDEY